MALGKLDQPAPSRPRSTERRMSRISVAAPSLAGGRQARKEPSKSPMLRSPSPGFAQAAGEKTAECAAVCCCFPFGMVNFFYVLVVKLPAGLLWRAVRRLRRKGRGKKAAGGGPAPKVGPFLGDDDEDLSLQNWALLERRGHHSPKSMSPSTEFVLLEEEMLECFRDLGFWRSLSQRDMEKHKTIAESPFSLPR